MTLVKNAQAVMATLAGPGTGPRTLDVSDTGLHFTCDLTVVDSVGCSFTSFRVVVDALASAPIERLKEVAESLSGRLTYLLEPITPIEVDPEHCVVQMRSNPPDKDEDRTSYYELLVERGGVLSLCRYVKPVGQVRETVPAHVTLEVFWKLLKDFASAA